MTRRAFAHALVLRCDASGRIEEVLHDDLGLEDRAARGVSLADIVDFASAEKARAFLGEISERGTASHWELNAPLGDEIALLHWTGVALAGGGFLLLAARTPSAPAQNAEIASRRGQDARRPTSHDDDLAQLTRVNNELATLQRDLARRNAELSRANDQKNQILGMAAHDLRNPLGIIQAYAKFLIDESGPVIEKEHAEFLGTIRSSAEFMLRMVDDLLDVSRIDAGRLDLDRRPAELVGLVRRIVALNQVLVQKKPIELRFDPALATLGACVDEHKVEQVLNNLLTNAAKFSPPGSRVDVRIERCEGEARIAVVDQGPGIPANEIGRLFRPFGRTSVRSTAGERSTGLGLAIARRIVEGHGGRIRVESEVGRGSTFHVALPLGDVGIPASVEDGGVSAAASTGAQRAPLRILVADDDAVSRSVVVRILERAGHQVAAAADGAAAVEQIAGGGFDVVVIDLEMPGVDGLAATRTLRAAEAEGAYPRIPVVVLSGHDPAEVSAACHAAGADTVFRKPVQPEALLARLAELAGPEKPEPA